MRQLRPYQRQAKESAFSLWNDHRFRSVEMVMATGTGKTLTFAHVIRDFPDHKGRCLVLAHRDELISQAVKTLREVCEDDVVEVEQGKRRAARNKRSLVEKYGKRRAHSRIVVASKDTMWRDHRLNSFEPDEFGLIVIDETHHWAALNKSYHDIVQKFPGAVILGTTATRRRGPSMFEASACDYGIAAAIDDGWLVRPVQRYTFVAGYDLESLRSPTLKRDFSEAELARLGMQEDVAQGMAHQIVTYAVQEGAKRRPGHILSTLVFGASVDHAELLADILNRRHAKDGTGRAMCISSRDAADPGRRAQIFEDFESGAIRYLANYGIATEGYDNPNIEMIFMGRPTSLAELAQQMVGRGTRPLEEDVPALNAAECADERKFIIANSEKPHVLVVVPYGSKGVHSLAKDVVDVLGGDYDEEVVREAKVRALRGDGTFRTRAELDAARDRVEERRREEYLRRREFILDCSFVDKSIDPFDPHDGTVVEVSSAAKLISVRQIAILKRFGIKQAEIDTIITSKEAQKLIGEIKSRQRRKLCSLAQKRVLEKYGYDVGWHMTRATADALMDALAKNNWRRPPMREPGEDEPEEVLQVEPLPEDW